MPATQTAPDPARLVAELIRDARNWATSHFTSDETVGRFTTVGGATVEVRALAKIATKRYPSTDRTVQVGAVASCSGHGCTNPLHEPPLTDAVPLDDDADKSAEAVTPLVQAAREWAQKHAEKCRAQAYTGH